MTRRAAAAVALPLALAGCGGEPPIVVDDPVAAGRPEPEFPGGPLPEPFPWKPLAAAGAAAAVGVALVLRARRGGPDDAVAACPPPPAGPTPEETARSALEALRVRDIADAAADDAWFVAAGDAVRTYLRGRHGVRTGERSTEEIVGDVPAPLRPRVASLLGRCDAVKFARGTSSAAERARWVDEALRLVHDGRGAA